MARQPYSSPYLPVEFLQEGLRGFGRFPVLNLSFFTLDGQVFRLIPTLSWLRGGWVAIILLNQEMFCVLRLSEKQMRYRDTQGEMIGYVLREIYKVKVEAYAYHYSNLWC